MLPQRIKVDNGPEFISRALNAWACFNKVKLDYSHPSTPMDNLLIESFNGSFREYVGAVRHRDSAWLDTRVGEIGQLRRRD